MFVERTGPTPHSLATKIIFKCSTEIWASQLLPHCSPLADINCSLIFIITSFWSLYYVCVFVWQVYLNLKLLGSAWVTQSAQTTLDFGSDQELRVVRSSSTLGSELDMELAWDSFSASPSVHPHPLWAHAHAHIHTFSLYIYIYKIINKYFFKILQVIFHNPEVIVFSPVLLHLFLLVSGALGLSCPDSPEWTIDFPEILQSGC